MALYSFSLEDLVVASGRSKSGFDDLWLITTVKVGTGPANGTSLLVGSGVQAGQGFTGRWSAGPFEVADGATAVAVYTLVNLRGSTEEDQEKLLSGLQADLGAALTQPAASGHEEEAVRRLFGAAGEVIRAPGVDVGAADCQGLVGIHVALFQGLNAPVGDEVITASPVTLSATAPAACGTAPQSTAVFSVRVGPNLFDTATPITPFSADYLEMEVFAVRTDGRMVYKVRADSSTFGSWTVLGSRTFTQNKPMVATVEATTESKWLFGAGLDGTVHQLKWDPATGWQDAGDLSPGSTYWTLWLNGGGKTFRVDEHGNILFADSSGWQVVPGLQTLPGGWVSSVNTGTRIVLYSLDPQTGVIRQSANTSPITPGGWSAWESIPLGPAIPSGTPLSTICSGDEHIELFVVDVHGQMCRLGWRPATGWGQWAVI